MAVGWIQKTPKVKALRTEPYLEMKNKDREGAPGMAQRVRVLVTKPDN